MPLVVTMCTWQIHVSGFKSVDILLNCINDGYIGHPLLKYIIVHQRSILYYGVKRFNMALREDGASNE